MRRLPSNREKKGEKKDFSVRVRKRTSYPALNDIFHKEFVKKQILIGKPLITASQINRTFIKALFINIKSYSRSGHSILLSCF